MTSHGATAARLRPTVPVCANEAPIAMLIEQTWAEAAYRTLRSKEGRSGLDGADGAAGRPAAAVVDLLLDGGVDGRDVVRRLRAIRPALPVVVVMGPTLDPPPAGFRRRRVDRHRPALPRRPITPRGPWTKVASGG